MQRAVMYLRCADGAQESGHGCTRRRMVMVVTVVQRSLWWWAWRLGCDYRYLSVHWKDKEQVEISQLFLCSAGHYATV